MPHRPPALPLALTLALLAGQAPAARADNFVRLDHQGAAHELCCCRDAPAVVMAQGNGCPIVRNAAHHVPFGSAQSESAQSDRGLDFEPGSKLMHRAACDGSARNPGDPPPRRDVPWGLQSWDEMPHGAMSKQLVQGFAAMDANGDGGLDAQAMFNMQNRQRQAAAAGAVPGAE